MLLFVGKSGLVKVAVNKSCFKSTINHLAYEEFSHL